MLDLQSPQRLDHSAENTAGKSATPKAQTGRQRWTVTSPTRKLPPHWAEPSAPRALRRLGRKSGSDSETRTGRCWGPRRPTERKGCPLGRPAPPLPQPRGGPITPAHEAQPGAPPRLGTAAPRSPWRGFELACAPLRAPGSGDHTAAHRITRCLLKNRICSMAAGRSCLSSPAGALDWTSCPEALIG